MDTSTQQPTRPRRRWFRFSLRTLLIVVTVSSIPLGWVGWRLEQGRIDRAAIIQIEKSGGIISFGANNGWEELTNKWFGGRVCSVSFSNSQVSDISSLAELKNLRRLELNSTQVSDLSPLADLKNLDDIFISNTPLVDLSPLADLKNLRMLFLWNTQVSDLSHLAELKGLEFLDLENSQVNDLSPLAELKNLRHLYLYHTPASDLLPLAKLKNLIEVRLDHTQVSDEQVQELRQALPNCQIQHLTRFEE